MHFLRYACILFALSATLDYLIPWLIFLITKRKIIPVLTVFITLGYRYLIICKVILIGLSEVLREALEYLLKRLVLKTEFLKLRGLCFQLLISPPIDNCSSISYLQVK